MKVLPISGRFNQPYYTNQKTTLSNSQDISSNHITDLNSFDKISNQLSFKAISRKTLEVVQKIPLEERIASIFEKFENGDLILVGKNINNAKTKMLESIESINDFIKRIFFINDEKFKGYLGFFKNNEGEREVINLNDFEIKLYDSESLKSDILTPHDSYYIYDYDIISVPGNKDKDSIQILPNSKVDLTGYRKSFCRGFDYKEGIKSEVEKLNRKVISQLSREVKETSSKVTFKDVGGQDELIKELKRSILYPIKYPEMYETFDVNKGFILYGPPGTGKTHIARALANESEANFISLNGLEMESKWVGESEENWRTLFEEARQKQPTIMFIDEIDAIGKSRGGVDTHGDKTLDQILTLVSDLDQSRDNIFIIGATNNFKALDKALIRSGRLSKHLEVKLPDLAGVKQIFGIHSARKPLDRNIDKDALIKRLFDLKTSGGDIRYIINEAHINGYERAGIHEKMENETITGKDKRSFRIIQEDFDKAIEKFVETRNGTNGKPIGFQK